MYCTNCGKKIDDNASKCPYCGQSTTNADVKKISNKIGWSNGKMYAFIIVGIILSLVLLIATFIVRHTIEYPRYDSSAVDGIIFYTLIPIQVVIFAGLIFWFVISIKNQKKIIFATNFDTNNKIYKIVSISLFSLFFLFIALKAIFLGFVWWCRAGEIAFCWILTIIELVFLGFTIALLVMKIVKSKKMKGVKNDVR